MAGRYLVTIGERAIRRSRRFPVDLPGVARSVHWQGALEVRITDLSAGGARVEGINLPIGSDVDLQFSPPRKSVPIDVRGFIVRSIDGAGVPTVGVAFRLVQPSMDVLVVTPRVKKIEGVPCVVVEDRLFLSGRLEERTIDWYTQDRQGNVWYFGESTAELDKRGHVTSTEGSWQAGRNGALPGIYMPANPRVGQSSRQELYKGHAEDHFRVLGLRAKVKVPYVSSTAALVTEEWTPLEPDVLDHKLYVRGIGNVLEHVKGPNERNALISVTHR